MSLNKKLQNIADRQYGYFTAAQAVNSGYSKDLQGYHYRKGNWQKIDRGLFRIPGCPDNFDSNNMRWSLWAQGQSLKRQVALGYHSAMYLYGLSEREPDKPHIVVSSLRNNRENPGCILHWEDMETNDYVYSIRGYCITSALKTLRDVKSDLLMFGGWYLTLEKAVSNNLITIDEARELNDGALPENLISYSCTQYGLDARASTDNIVELSKGIRMRNLKEMGYRNSPSSSFTLIEMLVVIAIISILASMMMPSISSSINSARVVQCASNLKSVSTAAHLYAGQNNDWYVPLRMMYPAYTISSVPWSQNREYLRLLTGKDVPNIGSPFFSSGTGNVSAGMVCPKAEYALKYTSGSGTATLEYAYNMNNQGLYYDGVNPFTIPSGSAGYKLSKIKKPSIRVAFFEGIGYSTGMAGSNPNTYYWVDKEDRNGHNYVAYRHGNTDAANIVYFDGRVQLNNWTLIYNNVPLLDVYGIND